MKNTTVLDHAVPTSSSMSWPKPRQLPTSGRTVPEMDPTMLPEPIRAWAVDAAARMSVPLDFLGVPAIVACSAVLGRKFYIEPDPLDAVWREALNLWGLIVAPPGSLKSPSLQRALAPLDKIEKRLAEDYEHRLEAWEADMDRHKSDRALGGPKPSKPQETCLVVHESTVQKLVSILKDNPNGVLVVQDELMGLLEQWKRPDKASDRAFYLKGWNGTGAHSVRSISRGTDFLPALCISFIAGTQPGPLAKYVRDAAGGGSGDDGLLQRFQLLVAPALPPYREDRSPPNPSLTKSYDDLVNRLWRLQARDLQLSVTPDGQPPTFRLDPEAQDVFRAWRTDLELRVRDDGLSSIVKTLLSKHRGLVPRLSALLHVIGGGINPIPAEAVFVAITWSAFLEKHADHVYAEAIGQAEASAHALAKRLKEGKLGGSFTFRDLSRKNWSRLTTVKACNEALQELVALDWLTRDPDTGAFLVNPRIAEIER